MFQFCCKKQCWRRADCDFWWFREIREIGPKLVNVIWFIRADGTLLRGTSQPWHHNFYKVMTETQMKSKANSGLLPYYAPRCRLPIPPRTLHCEERCPGFGCFGLDKLQIWNSTVWKWDIGCARNSFSGARKPGLQFGSWDLSHVKATGWTRRTCNNLQINFMFRATTFGRRMTQVVVFKVIKFWIACMGISSD